MTKTIEVVECKKCSTEYYAGETGVKLEPNDIIAFVTKRVALCATCREKNNRTISRPGKRLHKQ